MYYKNLETDTKAKRDHDSAMKLAASQRRAKKSKPIKLT